MRKIRIFKYLSLDGMIEQHDGYALRRMDDTVLNAGRVSDSPSAEVCYRAVE